MPSNGRELDTGAIPRARVLGSNRIEHPTLFMSFPEARSPATHRRAAAVSNEGTPIRAAGIPAVLIRE